MHAEVWLVEDTYFSAIQIKMRYILINDISEIADILRWLGGNGLDVNETIRNVLTVLWVHLPTI